MLSRTCQMHFVFSLLIFICYFELRMKDCVYSQFQSNYKLPKFEASTCHAYFLNSFGILAMNEYTN